MTGPNTPPPETPIEFQKSGPDLEVELTCGEAQMGSYTLRLWSPTGKKVVKKERGSFLDEEEDRYLLPGRAAVNDRRILQCRSRVWLIRGHKKYAVSMTVKQGGEKIGEFSASGESDEPTVIVDLRARLRGL